jgi:tetratricopeptide (TPR) repeat protein
MKRLFFTLIISFFMFAGCGLGTSDFQDAVLDGASNLNRGKTEKALEDFNRAIKVDPTHQDGYLGRADTLNVMGLYEESLKDYNKAIEINPTMAEAYINRPSFFKRLFSNDPNTVKGIRDHLEFLKQKVKDS